MTSYWRVPRSYDQRMKSRIVRQILVMGTVGASATVVVILASVKSFPIKSRLCRWLGNYAFFRTLCVLCDL